MKAINIIAKLLFIIVLNTSFLYAQGNIYHENNLKVKTMQNTKLKTYVIERDIPKAGNFTLEDLKGISQISCGVLQEMGSDRIQWLHSYVTENKIYCVYRAENKEAIKEHDKLLKNMTKKEDFLQIPLANYPQR